jgi:hypothetical protein
MSLYDWRHPHMDENVLDTLWTVALFALIILVLIAAGYFFNQGLHLS